MPTKKPPTRKQLIARRKFAMAARRRAKEARARKRAEAAKLRARNPKRRITKKTVRVVVHKGGKVLRGAAASALIKSRSPWAGKKKNSTRRRNVAQGFYAGGVFHPIRGSEDYSPGRAGETAHGKHKAAATRRRKSSLAAAAKSLRSTQARARRRKNPHIPASIRSLHRAFLGRPAKNSFEALAPAGAPKDLVQLGNLVQLRTENDVFKFDRGEALLCATGSGDLCVALLPGLTSNPDGFPVDPDTDYGKIEQVVYEAKKDHLDNALIQYYHKFGEEGGERPSLITNEEGAFLIQGGDYTIAPEGIRD